MTLPVKRAHHDLRKFCGCNAGFGISKALIESLLMMHINRSQPLLSDLPSTQRFHIGDKGNGLLVSFDAGLTIREMKLSMSSQQLMRPQVDLGPIVVTLVVKMDNRKVCEIDIIFNKIEASLSIVERRLQLNLIHQDSQETSFVGAWHRDQKTQSYVDPETKIHFENVHAFDADTWRRLELYFRAISLIATHEIAAAFLEAVMFPDLFSIFKGVVFGANDHLGLNGDGDLLMFTASSSLVLEECPIAPVTGTIRLDTDISPSAGDLDDSLPRVAVQVQKNSPALEYQSKSENTERLNTGDVFFYAPIQLLNVNFDGAIRPAIKISDRDTWGPFYYRWEVTPSLKEKVSISLEKRWPITFNLDAPLRVSGQAGAGVKIGSVRYEAASTAFEGIVCPFQIEFRIMLDWSRREIVFESRISQIEGHSFNFVTASDLGFPLNKIVDVVLGAAARTVVNEQAEKTLSVTRIPIANLNLLESVASLVEGLAGYADCSGNTTMGVSYVVSG